jgi:replicative DNA helicase
MRLQRHPFASDGRTARELVDEAEAKVFEIAEGGSRGRGARDRRSHPSAGRHRSDRRGLFNPDSLRGLPTGFTDFDKMTGGLRPGDLVIVAGRPSMGKTTLAVNMAEYAALRAADKRASVAIFSMEMPSEQVITRMLSSIGGVPLQNLRGGKISDDDWARITSATSQLSEAKIFVDETPALSPTELRARARRVKREHGLDLVVVDYLQLMQVPGNKENRATEIGEISRGLKVLAKELPYPRHRALAVESRCRAAGQQKARYVGFARERKYRTGCRHDPVDLSRGSLRSPDDEERPRRDRPREAP